MGLAGLMELIRRGLPMETVSMMGIATYPLQMIIPIFVAKYTLKKKEMQAYFTRMIIGSIFVIGLMLTIYVYDGPESGAKALFLVFLSTCISIIAATITDVSSFAFNTRICDESVGGTFITPLASVGNIPRIICPSFGLMMLSFVNFYTVNCASAVYQIWFISKFAGRCNSLQTAPKNVWDLDYTEQNDKYVEMTIQNEVSSHNFDRT